MEYITNSEPVAVERPKAQEPVNELMAKLRATLLENADLSRDIVLRMTGDATPLQPGTGPSSLTEDLKDLLKTAVYTHNVLCSVRSDIG